MRAAAAEGPGVVRFNPRAIWEGTPKKCNLAARVGRRKEVKTSMRTATLAGILALLLFAGTGAALMAASGQDVTAPVTTAPSADTNTTAASGNGTMAGCNGTGFPHGPF